MDGGVVPRHGRARQAVARHRPGRRRRQQGAGRGRPGHHVRLRLRRDRRADADADHARAQAREPAGGRPPQRQVSPGCGPDAKSQVTVEYENDRPVGIDTVLVSTQHAPETEHAAIKRVRRRRPRSSARCRPALLDKNTKYHVNPTGRFVIGGPHGDCGLTGRKIIVDTYGGMGRHGGGAFSGKDPSKVDRSAAYAARWVAKNIVKAGLARRCELQLSYAIGIAEPLSIRVMTGGTNAIPESKIEQLVREHFDLKPRGDHRGAEAHPPDLPKTASGGHFGRALPEFTWERTDKADALRAAAGLDAKPAPGEGRVRVVERSGHRRAFIRSAGLQAGAMGRRSAVATGSRGPLKPTARRSVVRVRRVARLDLSWIFTFAFTRGRTHDPIAQPFPRLHADRAARRDVDHRDARRARHRRRARTYFRQRREDQVLQSNLQQIHKLLLDYETDHEGMPSADGSAFVLGIWGDPLDKNRRRPRSSSARQRSSIPNADLSNVTPDGHRLHRPRPVIAGVSGRNRLSSIAWPALPRSRSCATRSRTPATDLAEEPARTCRTPARASTSCT